MEPTRHTLKRRREITNTWWPDQCVRASGFCDPTERHGLWHFWDARGKLRAEVLYHQGVRLWTIEHAATESPKDCDRTNQNQNQNQHQQQHKHKH